MTKTTTDLSYVHPTLRDIDGQPVTIKCAQGYQGYGMHPWGLTRSTAGGRRHYVCVWLLNGNGAEFSRKADTTTWINAHRELASSGRIPAPRDGEPRGGVIDKWSSVYDALQDAERHRDADFNDGDPLVASLIEELEKRGWSFDKRCTACGQPIGNVCWECA